MPPMRCNFDDWTFSSEKGKLCVYINKPHVCISRQWWAAAGLQCPPTDLQRVCFITLVHASLFVVTLGLS